MSEDTPEARALAELREESWGRVMPDAALKNVEAWEAREKEHEEGARCEVVRLATPVTVFLDGRLTLELPRLLYEEIESAQWSWCNAGHDFDDTIADVLKPLLREGFIALTSKGHGDG